MLIPLVLPALNVSSVLSSTNGNVTTLVAPNSPDTQHCHSFYANDNALDLPSCMRLINQLPQGSEPIRYYMNPTTAEQKRRSLPIVVGRRKCNVRAWHECLTTCLHRNGSMPNPTSCFRPSDRPGTAFHLSQSEDRSRHGCLTNLVLCGQRASWRSRHDRDKKIARLAYSDGHRLSWSCAYATQNRPAYWGLGQVLMFRELSRKHDLLQPPRLDP